MEDQANTLLSSLKQYEAQLAQIKQAIASAPSARDTHDLYLLEKDIEELISLTKENLNSLPSFEDSIVSSEAEVDPISQEYALFKAELAELEGDTPVPNKDVEDDASVETGIPQELQEDLDALKGSKCQAPYKQHWGDESYHNALIMDVETNNSVADMDHIQVRVMFVNPTEIEMLPCPYFLDGECRFTDDKCRFSHGKLVPLLHIREYREPDFSLVKEGSHVLAKQKDNIWHRAKVEGVSDNNRCLVKFQSKGCESVELDLHDLLPLSNTKDDDDSASTTSESEPEDVPPQEYFVQLSLLRTAPTRVLGAWEEHTKGIGSRLMANMGYVVGCGLGRRGEGRLEPVEAVVYPPGKSLDTCMALREAAGGDPDMFKAERHQKKQQRRLLRVQQRQHSRIHKKDVFSFLNSKLAGSSPPVKPEGSHPAPTLASSSRKGLNVERFRLGEDIKKTQKDIEKLKQSLKRHDSGSLTHSAISSKLEQAKTELNRLQNKDNIVAREQDQRDGRKKISVF